MPQLPSTPPLAVDRPLAIRPRQIIPLVETAPVLGEELLRPPTVLDNHWLLVDAGHIVGIERRKPVGFLRVDLGDVALLPPLTNAHTHLQLSWLAGQTLWHEGFVPWIRSMLALLLPRTASAFAPDQLAALATAMDALRGTIVGDIGGSIPGAIQAVHHLAQGRHIEISHFCEWFGFAVDDAAGASPWPPRARAALAGDAQLRQRSSPAGHALYSTAASTLQNAHAHCCRRGRVFTFHLAESPEETQLLLEGTGALAELYRPNVLPPRWRPPGLRPLALARQLGVLAPGTLAVHGVQLAGEEIGEFASTGAALCLCPRSNHNLGVGSAPIWPLLRARVPLCLGTDGLTSCEDLDVRREAFFLRENSDMPMSALWRMATVNGAAILGHGTQGLTGGAPAAFSLWPLDQCA